MRHRAPGRLPSPLLYLFLPSCPLILRPIISSPPSLRPSTFPTLRLLRHSELSSSSISRFPSVTHFLPLISPSSLSLHPIRFPLARLPRWASPVFFHEGWFNKVELHSWDACYIWSTFQPVCCEAQRSPLPGPAGTGADAESDTGMLRH